ncbi:MAG: LysR family transcriptional regulator [Bdellovibrionales bacterium]
MLIDHLEKIKHFLGVVRYGSIRKYSLKENISQSAVSKSMQILEGSLDTSLFIRKRTGIELTQAGTELLKFGESLNLMITKTEESLYIKSSLVLGGDLKIGSYHSISIYFMPRLLKFIKENQSKLKINLTSGLSKDLISNVESEDLDLCISVNPKTTRTLEHIPLYEDYYSFYQHVNLDDTKDIYTYIEARDAKNITVDKHITSLKKIYNIVSCGDFETAKAMAKEKLGLALLPNWVAFPLVENGIIQKVKLKSLPLNFGKHHIGLSYKKKNSGNPAIKWVSEQTKLMLGV